ncbi:NAD-dependent succinate-semialdehyde dehydrogenase [Microbaculum sp. FT89]|uniref:NAD-dependent succinate-semialdehyde dehydrogenase n=1 Tax=Microbaculum sp. FT89 TaxID=3447298 RepID=UPI003F536443
MYPTLKLYIDGVWRDGSEGASEPVYNPATGEVIATLPHASRADLDDALASSRAAFAKWKKVSAHERSTYLKKVAALLRERSEQISQVLTLEQGKPLPEARVEMVYTADVFEWYAEEARRTYGHIIPARNTTHRQMVLKEPIGPALGLSPWNFPGIVPARKVGAALAAGCVSIIKASEETPGTCVEIVRACHDAGIPAGVVNMVFGVPAEISSYLMASDVIRQVSFTGSIPVGKHLARLASDNLIRCTLELGGHAPVIVLKDADVRKAARVAATGKFYRNAGQVCVSPTRFLVEAPVYDAFVEEMTTIANSVKVGNGAVDGTEMGPLANPRRLDVMEELVADARTRGARIAAGGNRVGNQGNFWAPTVIADVTTECQIMNDEPFGPLAPIMPVDSLDAAIAEANRLPVGLASYVFTSAMDTARQAAEEIEAGVVTINHVIASMAETPFGGVKQSGDGREGGAEGLEEFLVTKYVSEGPAV